MNEKENKISEKTNILNNLSDGNLYLLCKRYGEMTLKWRRKFASLLPEVFKRKLYEKKGFSDIFEFAAKLAGMSEKQVRRVLSLNEKFEDKPILEKMLIEGKESVNKLARIASIATSENEEFLAVQLKLLSNRAVETLVRDIKFESQNGLFEPKVVHKFVHVQTLNLSEEVVGKLAELQSKGIDLNELLLEFLKKRKEEIEELKKEISKEISARKEQTSKITVTRYIPMKIKKIIHQEHGTKCSIPNCTKPATNLHHTQRFSLSKTHDPHFIAPLCREHHELAHSADLAYHKIGHRIT